MPKWCRFPCCRCGQASSISPMASHATLSPGAKDLATRVESGGFLPGCGVGTGFRREALELLAERDANQIFHPGALTEDYDTGCRLRQLGCRQVIVPLAFQEGVPLATRAYFPRTQRAAARHRSRW